MRHFMRESVDHRFTEDKISKRDALAQALGSKMSKKMIKDVKLIRERMKQTQDHHKSYINQRK